MARSFARAARNIVLGFFGMSAVGYAVPATLSPFHSEATLLAVITFGILSTGILVWERICKRADASGS